MVSKLVTSDNVVAVIGENSSNQSLAAAPICQSAKVPMISPSSTNPNVTKKGDYIFRVCFIDNYQGPVMAKFALNELHSKHAAILTEPLKTHAEIAETIAFVGLGHKFQIWEPERFRAQLAEATGKVRALKKQLGSRVAAEDPRGARE